MGEGTVRNEAGKESWLDVAHSPRASEAQLRGFHSILSTLAFRWVMMFCFLNSRTKFPVKTQPVMQVRKEQLWGQRPMLSEGNPRNRV